MIILFGLSRAAKELMEVAEAGDIKRLYQFLDSNPEILEYLDKKPVCHTPLHAAVLSGQIGFAMEMMNLKPSFAKKLNPDGYSPLHLSLQKVLNLFSSQEAHITMEHDDVHNKEKEGYTPFLYAIYT